MARELLEKVSPSQFHNRIKLVDEVDVAEKLKDIELPLLYIQATKDLIFKQQRIELFLQVQETR